MSSTRPGELTPVRSVALPHNLTLPEDRTLIMGVLNMTPDSFSDGGLWLGAGAALDHASHMRDLGADIIDVGGESTRPGATRVTSEEEWQRIGHVVPTLVQAGLVVSVDTVHADTAQRAIDAGVAIINDVSGGRIDPAMNAVVAASDAVYVIQHYRALPGQPGEHFDYGDDLIATLVARLTSQIEDALQAGVQPERIIVDPGLGFSLNPEQCWEIVDNLDRFHSLRRPVLVGASRKRFLATRGDDRDALTAEVSVRVAQQGAWAVRVHDVARNRAALAH